MVPAPPFDSFPAHCHFDVKNGVANVGSDGYLTNEVKVMEAGTGTRGI